MNMATNLKDVMGGEPAAIADAIAASAHEIWQAGLGAFARAQADGGELFGALVRDGAALHKLTQELAQDKFPDVAGKIGKLAEQVGRQASGSWDKIEKIFEDRVARSLRSLGVPSREEVDALRREIEALREAASAPARTSAPKPVKTAAKRAAAPPATASKRPAKSKSTRAQPARRNA
jgi:poly(hydroxyalkanoate) granule-associated protein